MYQVITVPHGAAEQIEQLGTKRKFWYDDERYLFKVGRPDTGENWAEKVCAEIAACLNLPHASYDLATYEGRQGVVTPNFVPEGARLIHGNELIGVVSTTETNVRDLRRQLHTPRRVYLLLRQPTIEAPLGWVLPEGIHSSAEIYLGYLMLDALVGNQDRHEENWALLLASDGRLHLAPTFDHASSLGRNETDEARLRKLAAESPGHSVEAYVLRARSQLYDADQSRLGTYEALRHFGALVPTALTYWVERLRALEDDQIASILEQIPAEWMSQAAKDFGSTMMRLNRERILKGVLP